MKEEWETWLDDNSAENFLLLREAVAESKEYQPYSHDLDKANDLLAQGKYWEVIEHLYEQMSNLLMSPAAHQMIAFAAHKLGDKEQSEMELYLAMALLEGILTTGDGSRERPYLVLRTDDEYDVLHHLDKKTRGQSLFNTGDQQLDCQDCEDGTQLWFDITAQYRTLRGV